MKIPTVDQLKSIRIFNAYNFTAGAVYIQYISAERGRGGHGGYVSVFKNNERTNPNGAWYEQYNKVFNPHLLGGKLKALEAAMAWATEKYGVTEWAKGPFGIYVSSDWLANRLTEIKELLNDRG